jgi:glycosyltransferase involved in cell wall biosynthesis
MNHRNSSRRSSSSEEVLFLSWESPWPAHSGAALRTLGLLKELSKAYPIELILLTCNPLTSDQYATLEKYARAITRVPLRDVTLSDKIKAASLALVHGYPYHSAVLLASLRDHPEVRRKIEEFPGIVFTSTGHWGTLVRNRRAPNWILNQCDADVEFWRVYATQTTHPLARLAARVNYRLARNYYPSIYASVGRIVSVCEEDRQHTLTLAPQAQVDVIENGVDCSYYVPRREARLGPPRLLFTGTSAARNMTALHRFVRNIFPLIRSQMPDVELLVGGNFSPAAQAEFAGVPNIRFTGRVDDMRPIFDQSDVFVAPFEETHGSKLKIAEAMAMAMPIVSTPAGIRGFALRENESVLVAQDSTQFAGHVVALLNDPLRRERLGTAARQAAITTIDWAVLGKRLMAIVDSVASSNKEIPEDV